MRAYSMDLRERVLHDSDAGMQAADGREANQCLGGSNNGGGKPAKSPRASSVTGGIRCSRPSCTRDADRTLADLQVALGTSHDLAGRAATVKKNGTRVRTRSPRRLGDDCPDARPDSVFLDESGVATNLLRRWAQAVADHAPQGRWESVPRCG